MQVQTTTFTQTMTSTANTVNASNTFINDNQVSKPTSVLEYQEQQIKDEWKKYNDELINYKDSMIQNQLLTDDKRIDWIQLKKQDLQQKFHKFCKKLDPIFPSIVPELIVPPLYSHLSPPPTPDLPLQRKRSEPRPVDVTFDINQDDINQDNCPTLHSKATSTKCSSISLPTVKTYEPKCINNGLIEERVINATNTSVRNDIVTKLKDTIESIQYTKQITDKAGNNKLVNIGKSNSNVIANAVVTSLICGKQTDQEIEDETKMKLDIKQHLTEKFELEKRSLKGQLPTLNGFKIIKDVDNLKENKKPKVIIFMTEENADNIIRMAMEKSLSAYHADVADAMILHSFCSYGSSIKKRGLIYNQSTDTVYKWNTKQSIWRNTKINGKPFFNVFTKGINRYIDGMEQMKSTLKDELKQLDNITAKERVGNVIKQIISLIGKLKTVAYKTSLMTQLKIAGATSFDNIDIISPIIPLNDGTNFNIFTHESTPRTVNDKNRFTRCINAHIDPSIKSIVPDEKDDKSAHRIIYDLLLQIFWNQKDLLETFLIFGGVYISGDVTDKSFAIFSGETNGGKSIIAKLFFNLLGPLCTAVASGVVYEMGGKSANNAHTAHLTALRGKVLGINSEAETNVKGFNTKIMKSITGGDNSFSRGCGEGETTGDPFPVHLFIFGNTFDMPKLPFGDTAFEDRTHVFPMRAYFETPGIPIRYKHQKPLAVFSADRFLDEKIKDQGVLNALFTLLAISAGKYFKNKKKMFPLPECMIDATRTFIGKSYIYDGFLAEYCDLDPDYKVLNQELFDVYHDLEHGKDGKIIFYSNIREKFGKEFQIKGVGRYFHGLKIKKEYAIPNVSVIPTLNNIHGH